MWRYQPLVVRWNGQIRTKYLDLFPLFLVAFALVLFTMDHFSNAISLRQILIRVVHIFDRPEEGLGNRVVVLNRGVELKQVADRRLALCEIRAGGDMERVEDIVIEVVFVWTNTWMLRSFRGKLIGLPRGVQSSSRTRNSA